MYHHIGKLCLSSHKNCRISWDTGVHLQADQSFPTRWWTSVTRSPEQPVYVWSQMRKLSWSGEAFFIWKSYLVISSTSMYKFWDDVTERKSLINGSRARWFFQNLPALWEKGAVTIKIILGYIVLASEGPRPCRPTHLGVNGLFSGLYLKKTTKKSKTTF